MSIIVPNVSGPLSVTGVARPLPGQSDALRAALESLVEPTRAEPGCITYEVGADAHGSVRFMECWASADALRRHLQAPHVRAYASVSDSLNEPLELHWLTPLGPNER